MSKKIVVIGSINMDLVTETDRVPKEGETILGVSFQTIPGGKGANQAVAAARLGANVTLLGRVGDDLFGQELVDHLTNENINMAGVEVVNSASTGIASITLSQGDNRIIVVPGANSYLTEDIVEQYEDEISRSDIVLLQLEIPLMTVIKAIELAKKHHVTVILNPAPIQDLPKHVLENVDYITPNEHEQELILDPKKWSVEELEEIKRKCIVTKGSKGVTFFQNGEKEIPTYSVDVVDTTGAGDSFNGALAVGLSEGMEVEEACRFANAVAALSVTKLGAQVGMPTREKVDEFLKGTNPNQ